MKIVEEIYNSLKSNPEIKKWIKNIKSHEWIKVIEEERSFLD